MVKDRQKVVLVLYYTRYVYPLRDTIYRHLYCFHRYGRHRYVFVNAAMGTPREWIRAADFDAVIFHTSFCSMRWTESTFRTVTDRFAFVADLDSLNIAIPQDEFMRTDLLNELMLRFQVAHVLTCADPADWPRIYCDLDHSATRFRTVLTGYVDPVTVSRIEDLARETVARTIDVGYRAWKAEPWLGEHGQHKVWVATQAAAACDRLGLKADISLRVEDTFHGDEWFAFLLRCRGTIGVAGGASVLDRDGALKRCTDDYVGSHPEATFNEVREACFPGRDGELGLACISPRHLEACATRTAQVLIEGDFGDVLEPEKHYIPLDRDYRNIDEALARLRDAQATQRMVDRAYADVVASNRWSYESFVRSIEASIIDAAPTHERTRQSERAVARLHAMDASNWRTIRREVQLTTSRPGRTLASYVRRAKRLLTGAR